jgi:DNA adenine methylase
MESSNINSRLQNLATVLAPLMRSVEGRRSLAALKPFHRFADPVDVLPDLRRSPFSRGRLVFPMKCPGSKCWFLPYAKEFLRDSRPKTVVEPFAGSGVVGLTLLSEGRAENLVLAEIDERRLAFWKRVFEPDFADHVDGWAQKALALPIAQQREFVLSSLAQFERQDLGMWALVYSRVSHSGKMDGGLMKNGDHGKGLMCRWRKDMVSMLHRVYELKDRVEVRNQDGLEVLREFDSADNYAFVDPPYSAGEDSQGPALYRNYGLHHPSLFSLMSEWRGRWQMTYDICWETLGAGEKRMLLHPDVEPWKHFRLRKVLMTTGNNEKKYELVVTGRRGKPA